MKLSASILAAQLTSLSNTLQGLDRTAIDYIHIDVMDGNFVPQISFGEAYTKEIPNFTSIPLDVHLMVKNPELEIPKYFPLKPEYITFHAETTHFGIRLIDEIHSQNIKAGLAINPGTSLESITYLLPHIDLLLVMTVDPGFYGQKFVKNGLEKIKKAKDLLDNSNCVLEVDGGVNKENIQSLNENGVDICVAGSAIFSNGKPNENASTLKYLTKKAI